MAESGQYKTELAHAVLDVGKRRILTSLLSRQQHISELAASVALERSAVAYHLTVLEQLGLVESHYRILKQPASPGKAARVFRTNTKRFKEAIDAVDSLTNDLKSQFPG